MKFGIRTPSLKRIIKAKTSGRMKRSVKSTLIPLYGKKGMGLVKEPKRAMVNKMYSKTSVSLWTVLKRLFIA